MSEIYIASIQHRVDMVNFTPISNRKSTDYAQFAQSEVIWGMSDFL